MRLRKLALAVGLAGTMGAQLASALGLGEIRLQSRLNEPLTAEIKLLQVRDLTKSEILVDLASNDDFQRAGIDRVFFLTDLRFEIDLNSPSGPVIRVTSKKPVKEPYLNFLLESQWPNGRILREYTLLMDLPTFSDQKAAPVQSARSSSGTTSSRSTPARNTPPAGQQPSSGASSRSSAPAYQGDVYGPVGSSDTLWEIALKVRPNRQYSVQQTMLAIQRLNPEAFINGNINLLRKGQVLRVPTGNDIDNIQARQAVSEVAQQNSEWSGYAGGPQLEGSKRQQSTSGSQQEGVSGRLTVAGADTSESMQAGRAAGEVGGDTASLQNELAISQEELDRSRRENAELKDRVAEMEDQIETMERLLEVSSEELQALQQQAASSSSEDQQDIAQQSADSQAAAPQSVEQSKAPAAETKPQATKPVDSSKVVRSAKPKEPSFMDMVMDNILYIGGAIVAILAGLFLLLRRRSNEDEEAEGYTPSAPVAQPEEPEADIDAAIESGVADDFDMDNEDVDLSEEDELMTAAPTESQTGDAVGEADIYIAYGKFDQAEEMLQNALEQDSNNTAARLKLMEVYLETQDLDKFDQQYSEVSALGDASAIARADDLREQFADAPAYTEDTGNDFSLGNEEFELDLNDAEVGDSEVGSDEELLSLSDEAENPLESETGDSEFSIGEDFSLSFESELTSTDRDTMSDESDESDDEFVLDFDDTESLSDESFDLELDEGASGEDSLELELSDAPEGTNFLSDSTADSTNEDADSEELTFDLAEDDSEPLTLDLPEGDDELAADELDLELDSSDDDGDAFDLDMDDMDLAALDEEVSALSENMDFAGEEFGSDDASGEGDALNLEGDELSLEDVESSDFDASTLEFDSAEGDELSLELGDIEGLDDSGKLEETESLAGASSTEDSELTLDTLDFDADLEDGGKGADSDFDLQLEGLDSELESLDSEAVTDELVSSEDDASELSLDDVPTLEDEAVESAAVSEDANESEEFDLAADLGLDADDFAESDASEDDVFTEAMSDLPTPEDVMDGDMSDEDFDAELDFLADTDEAATKLDLARAYIDMGDQDGAKDILGEVVVEGNDVQKKEAEELLTRIG
ncbi:FimV/HubP family polar landmark protein [Pseudomaricurvus sp.]|uniref:FimV/HubP family polar landmark protein n=1 Tax=Pseudomaricurvus sp. TaxID=2004510 RepID=UPI003F6CDBBF